MKRRLAGALEPQIVILGGPNGSGRSTAAPHVLRGAFAVDEFVNADVVARGLSGFDPMSVARSAARVVLGRLNELVRRRVSFAFESTLAGRGLAALVATARDSGYWCELVFLWLPSPEVAVARVAERVRLGGHSVPERVIRRRYRAGLNNFFGLYRPLASSWQVYDGSQTPPVLIAAGSPGHAMLVARKQLWNRIEGEWES